jgi:chaperone required for assembly of F1-ATPase
MSWAAKRFWTAAKAEPCDGGYRILLDARAVKTPAKAPLILPSLALADALAAEWEAQTGKVDPATMPLTRMANSAIDKIAPQFAEVAAMIAAYGGSDLLCYRATHPQELVARQAAAWDAPLAWAAHTLGAPLLVTAGITHVAQPPQSLARLSDLVHGTSAFELAALHDLVAVTGSLILGFAVAQGHLTAEQAWRLSRLDDDWQTEHWGEDDLARRSEVARHTAILDADRFLRLYRSQSA